MTPLDLVGFVILVSAVVKWGERRLHRLGECDTKRCSHCAEEKAPPRTRRFLT